MGNFIKELQECNGDFSRLKEKHFYKISVFGNGDGYEGVFYISSVRNLLKAYNYENLMKKIEMLVSEDSTAPEDFMATVRIDEIDMDSYFNCDTAYWEVRDNYF